MKEIIKSLAKEQKELKSQRKTGTLPTIVERDYFGLPIWPAETKSKINSASNAAMKVAINKARITAAINVCHESRGSTYRHNVPDEYKRLYDRFWQEYMYDMKEAM